MVPDLVTTLTIPPERPAIFRRRNCCSPRGIRCTDSCGGVARCTPLFELTKSAPSTVISLLNERMPPKEICVISNSVNVVPRLVRLVATPGVRQSEIGEQSAADRQSLNLLGVDDLADFGAGRLHHRSLGSNRNRSLRPLRLSRSTLTVAVWPTASTIPVCGVLPEPAGRRGQVVSSGRKTWDHVKAIVSGSRRVGTDSCPLLRRVTVAFDDRTSLVSSTVPFS